MQLISGISSGAAQPSVPIAGVDEPKKSGGPKMKPWSAVKGL